MKQKYILTNLYWLMLCFVIIIPLSQSYGQDGKNLAKAISWTKGGLLSPPGVKDAEAINKIDDNYAVLQTGPGIIVGLGAYDNYIKAEFKDDIDGDTWTYIHLESDRGLFEALVGGTLGDVLSSVLNLLALGTQYIDVKAYASDGKVVLNETTQNGFSDGKTGVVMDAEGNYLLAIKPSSTYREVEVRTRASFTLLGLTALPFELKVFSVFTLENTDNVLNCGKPIATSFDGGEGLSLEVLPLEDQNLVNAIDSGNEALSTFSTLKKSSLLDISVLTSFSQIFYFPSLSDKDATFNIKLELGGASSSELVDLNLLGGLEVLAYNGAEEVYRTPLINGLVADLEVLNLLELFQAGEPTVFVFGPGHPFDKVEVRVNQGASIGLLSQGVNIYDVERFDSACPNPEITIKSPTVGPFEAPFCDGYVVDSDNVDFPFNAMDGNNETFASLVSSNGSLLALGATESMIQLSVPTGLELSANTTSYIRVDMEDELLDALLSGTIGTLLGGTVGALLGDHIITVEAFDGAQSVLSATSIQGFVGNDNGKVTVVQDNIGRTYLAVTPNSKYNSVKISTRTAGLLGTGGVNVLNVYNMCHETGTDPCWPVQFTSWDQTGLNLGVGDDSSAILGGAGVIDASHAIDANSSHYSIITQGTIGLLASVYQSFYFTQPSLQGDQLKVRLKANNAGVLNLGVLGSYQIVTYLGNAEKERFLLQDGVINNIDLLVLFQSGGMQTLLFDTQQPYDRVEIVANSVAALNLSESGELRIYEVKRVGENCQEIPGIHPFESPVCADIIIESSNVSDIANLTDGNFNSYATLESDAGVIFGSNASTGVVELAYAGEIPGGTTSYIRFDVEDTLLEGLVSGSIGNIVTGLVNNILLGNHYFVVEAKSANQAVVLTADSSGQIAADPTQGDVRVVLDKQGRTYLAITPKNAYKSVRIEDFSRAIVGLTATSYTMNIYGMCYESVINRCQEVFATSYESSGLDLSIEGLSNYGVSNPDHAINDNSTAYSEISLGTLAIGSKVKQWFYFNTESAANDVVNIDFSTYGGTVNADILGGIIITAYKDDVPVGTPLVLSNGLINNVSIEQLLQNGQRVVLSFEPGASYDRISIEVETLVNVAVGSTLRIYNVGRACAALVTKRSSIKSNLNVTQRIK